MSIVITRTQGLGRCTRLTAIGLLFCLLGWLTACSTITVPQSPQLTTQHPLAVIPLRNLSQTPLAGEKAEQSLLTLLLQRGIRTQSPPQKSTRTIEAILNGGTTAADTQRWLAGQSFDFVLSGTVNEWGYSKGLSGDPSVSITLWLSPADQPDAIIWRATGSRVGLGYKNIVALAQDVLSELLEGINIAQ